MPNSCAVSADNKHPVCASFRTKKVPVAYLDFVSMTDSNFPLKPTASERVKG